MGTKKKRNVLPRQKLPGTAKLCSVGRKCKVCKVSSTSQWRKGPDGKTSLCNACGLRYKWILEKEKKIEPKNTTPVNISSLLNPTQSPRSSPMKPISIPVVLDRNSPLPLSF